jgi:uncharacterized protein (TIGR00369 family)
MDPTEAGTVRVYDVERYLQGVRRFMEDLIPFNKLLGIQAGRVERNYVELYLPFKEELLGNAVKGVLHGGALSTLADAAGGAAVFASADFGDIISTIDLRIDYLRPAGPFDTLAEARVVRMGGRVGVARVQMYQPEHKDAAADDKWAAKTLVAEATAVYNVRRQVY